MVTSLPVHFPPKVPPKKGRRSILDLEPLVQTECQIDEMKKKIKDLTQELLDMREQKVEVEKVRRPAWKYNVREGGKFLTSRDNLD